MSVESTSTCQYPLARSNVENSVLQKVHLVCHQFQGVWARVGPLPSSGNTGISFHHAKTTGATPFSLMFGREVHLPIDLMFNTLPDHPPPSLTSEYAQTLWEHLQEAYQEYTKTKQLHQKVLCDRQIGGHPYLVNDHVWLHSPAVPKGPAWKFHQPWQGPFRVVTVLSDAVYCIKRVGSRQRKLVHYDRLKPYNGPEMEEEGEATPTTQKSRGHQVHVNAPNKQSQIPTLMNGRYRTPCCGTRRGRTESTWASPQMLWKESLSPTTVWIWWSLCVRTHTCGEGVMWQVLSVNIKN